MTQDRSPLNSELFVVNRMREMWLSVESAPHSSVRRLLHLFCLRSMMSLHLMTLLTAHPAKLVNLLALLLAFPGSWLLHATRRREQRAMASRVAQRQGQPNVEPSLDWATLRMNRFFYRFGFACLGLALLVSWISTRV